MVHVVVVVEEVVVEEVAVEEVVEVLVVDVAEILMIAATHVVRGDIMHMTVRGVEVVVVDTTTKVDLGPGERSTLRMNTLITSVCI